MNSEDIPEGYSEIRELLIEDLKLKRGVSLDKYSEFISKESATFLSIIGFTKYLDKIDFLAPRRDLLQIIVNNNRALELVESNFEKYDKILSSYDILSIVLSNPNEYLLEKLDLTSYQLSVVALTTKRYDLIDWSEVTRYDRMKIANENSDFTDYDNQILWDDWFGFIFLSFMMSHNKWKFFKNHIKLMTKKFIDGIRSN